MLTLASLAFGILVIGAICICSAIHADQQRASDNDIIAARFEHRRATIYRHATYKLNYRGRSYTISTNHKPDNAFQAIRNYSAS